VAGDADGGPARCLLASVENGRVGHAYVQLSVAYAAVADQAQAAGWPVARYSMDHLAPLSRPREVAGAIADSLAAAGAAAAGHR
jgi:hypothetical protein